MNKICTNPKNYKLTQGKVYEILDEEDDIVYAYRNIRIP